MIAQSRGSAALARDSSPEEYFLASRTSLSDGSASSFVAGGAVGAVGWANAWLAQTATLLALRH